MLKSPPLTNVTSASYPTSMHKIRATCIAGPCTISKMLPKLILLPVTLCPTSLKEEIRKGWGRGSVLTSRGDLCKMCVWVRGEGAPSIQAHSNRHRQARPACAARTCAKKNRRWRGLFGFQGWVWVFMGSFQHRMSSRLRRPFQYSCTPVLLITHDNHQTTDHPGTLFANHLNHENAYGAT